MLATSDIILAAITHRPVNTHAVTQYCTPEDSPKSGDYALRSADMRFTITIDRV